MAFERQHGETTNDARAAYWNKRMAQIGRGLRRAEDSLEKAASDFYQLADDIETGEGPLPLRGGRKRRQEPPLPFATAFAVTGTATVGFVVHGAEFRVELTRLRMDLLLLLKASKESADDLVGFKTRHNLVHALRARGWNATARSVTVEVSRVKTVLGPINCRLIESGRGAGYRFRLLRSAAVTGGAAARNAEAL